MKTTVGLIVGIAVGVCIGLLVAPDSGSETRKKLADSAGDWIDKLKNLFTGSEENEPCASAFKKISARRTEPDIE